MQCQFPVDLCNYYGSIFEIGGLTSQVFAYPPVLWRFSKRRGYHPRGAVWKDASDIFHIAQRLTFTCAVLHSVRYKYVGQKALWKFNGKRDQIKIFFNLKYIMTLCKLKSVLLSLVINDYMEWKRFSLISRRYLAVLLFYIIIIMHVQHMVATDF